MSSKKFKLFLITALFLVLLTISFVFLLNMFLQHPNVQRFILSQLPKGLGYEFHTKRLAVSLRNGLGISAYDLEAISIKGSERISVSRLTMIFDTSELLRGQMILSDLILFRPRIEMAIKKSDASKKAMDGIVIVVKKILVDLLGVLHSASIREGQIIVHDPPIQFHDLSLDINHNPDIINKFQIRLQGEVSAQKDKVPFSLKGTIKEDGNKKDDFLAHMTIKTGNFPLSWIPWPGKLLFKRGRAKTDITFTGSLKGPISAKGKVMTEDIHFMLIGSKRTKDYLLPSLDLEFYSHYSQKVLQIPLLRLNASDFSLEIQTTFDFRSQSSPHLFLSVKSPFMPLKSFKRIYPTPILSDLVEKHIFPVLTGGHVRLTEFSLKGTFHEIKKLKKPENKEVLFMEIVLKNVTALKDKGGLPFKSVSGIVKIKNGGLFISAVRGGFGRSAVREASLVVNRLYDKDRLFRFSVNGRFNLNDIKHQAKLEFTPKFIQHQLQKFQILSGDLETRFQVHYKKAWENPEIISGKFRFKDCAIIHKELVFPLLLDQADLTIEEKLKSRFKGNGKWGKSDFFFSGTAENFWQRSKVDVAVWTDLNTLMARFYKKQQLPITLNEPIKLQFSLSKTERFWSSQGRIDLMGIVIDTGFFSINPQNSTNRIDFKLDYYPKEKLSLDRFQWFMGKSIINLSGHYSLNKNKALNLRIATKGLTLNNLRILKKGTKIETKGIISGKAEVNTSVGKSLNTSITGELEAQNLSFAFNQWPFPIQDCYFKLRFNMKEVLISFLKFKLAQSPVKSPIQIHGHLRGWDGVKGKLNVKTNELDMSALSAYKKVFSFRDNGLSTNRFMERSDIQLNVKIDKGRWRKLEYAPLEAQFTYRKGHFFIERSTIQAGQSVLRLKGHYKTGKKPEMLFSSYIKLTKHPLHEILQSFDLGKYLSVSNVAVNTEGYIFMKGMNKKQLIESLTGAVNLHMENGIIHRSNVILRVLKILSLKKIIHKQPKTLPKEGFYFESIYGYITGNNGVLETKNLIMKSPTFNAAANGKVDLNREWVNYDLEFQPFLTVSSLVDKIPIIKNILKRVRESLLIYSFNVEGPLSNPKIQYRPWENLKNIGLWSYKHSIHAPQRLFKKTIEIKEDLQEKNILLPGETFEGDETNENQ